MTKAKIDLPSLLTINPQNKLMFTPQFNSMLDTISSTVNHARNLVTVQTVDKLNEKSLETTISDLEHAQTVARDVNAIRKQLKHYLKDQTDAVIDQFDQALDKAHFKELANYNAQAKTLKKELSAYRINQRWSQIKDTFDINLDNYPIINQLAPKLANFDLFKLRHPKLVTGAKSWRFGDKQMKIINQDLYDIDECLTDLKTNTVNLGPAYQNSILQSFINNPDKASYYELKTQMIAKQEQDRLNAEKEAELKRQRDLLNQQKDEANKNINNLKLQQSQTTDVNQKAKLNQAVIKNQQQLLNINNNLNQLNVNQSKTVIPNQNDKVREWLGNFVMANMLKYGNVAKDNNQKVKLVYDLVHALDNPASRFNELLSTVNTQEEKNQLILTTLNEVINV